MRRVAVRSAVSPVAARWRRTLTNWWWALLGTCALVYLLTAALALGVRIGAFTPYVLTVATLVAISAAMAASLQLVNGYAGQFSLGHAAFMSVGAYTGGLLTTRVMANWLKGVQPDSPAAILALLAAAVGGGVVAALFGIIVGLPTLRLRGDYLAIATLGFAEVLKVVLQNVEAVGGARGLTVPNYTTFPIALGMAAVTVMVLRNLCRSRFGRALVAIRENETAAEALGISSTKYKVMAFAVSAFFAGAAGTLHAHQVGVIAPKDFGFLKSIDYVVMCVLGGSGSLTGAVGGAVMLTSLPVLLRQWEKMRMVIYSLLLIIMMLTRRQGILGTRELSWRELSGAWRFAARLLRRKGSREPTGKGSETSGPGC